MKLIKIWRNYEKHFEKLKVSALHSCKNSQKFKKISKNDSKIFSKINLIGFEFKNFGSKVAFDA